MLLRDNHCTLQFKGDMHKIRVLLSFVLDLDSEPSLCWNFDTLSVSQSVSQLSGTTRFNWGQSVIQSSDLSGEVRVGYN